MDELKMLNMNSLSMSSDRMESGQHQLTVVKTEWIGGEVANAGISMNADVETATQNGSICDNPVKMKSESPTLSETSKENGKGQAIGAKLPTASRSKLIYSCHRCKAIFNSRISFESHYKETYNEMPVYTCLICDKQMKNRSSYQRHYNGHANTKEFHFKCTLCTKTFAHEKLFAKHCALHSLKTAKACPDADCQQEFFDLHEFKVHCRTHDDQKKNDQQKWKCDDCGKILKNRSSLTMHTKIHKNDRQFCCVLCDQKFVQKINLINHVKALHCAIKSHSCQECGKSFVGQSQLLRHHTYHTNVRTFECEVCKKMYKTKRDLKLHLMVHQSSRPHKCSSCEKTFLSTSKLKQHLNIHTGSRPYKCDYCPKDFTNFPNWLKHTRRRHKVDHKTGEKLVVMPKFLNKVKKSSTVTSATIVSSAVAATSTVVASSETVKKKIKQTKPRRSSESRKKKEIEQKVQNIKKEPALEITSIGYVTEADRSTSTTATTSKSIAASAPAPTDLSTIMVNDKTLPLNTSDDLERAASLLMQQTIDFPDEIEFMGIKSESNDASFYQNPYNFNDKLQHCNTINSTAVSVEYCPNESIFSAIDSSSVFSYYSHAQPTHYDFTMMPLPPINTVKSKLKTIDPKRIYTSTANVL